MVRAAQAQLVVEEADVEGGVVRNHVRPLDEGQEIARDLGIPAIALFPYTQPDRRSDGGEEALNPDNLVCRALRAMRDTGANVGLLTDVALDPYTSHGHDGLLDGEGHVLNDVTVEVLVGQALNQARAGADIIAPTNSMKSAPGISFWAICGTTCAGCDTWAWFNGPVSM